MPVSAEDLEQVLVWRNSDYVRQNSFNDLLISKEEHLAWFQGLSSDLKSSYLIFRYSGIAEGVVSFSDISTRHGTCEWGFYLGSIQHAKGLGSAMGITALEHAFHDRGLRKVVGKVLARNPRSLRFHERLGFTKEGVLRKHVKLESGFSDVVIFSIFKEYWERESKEIMRGLLV